MGQIYRQFSLEERVEIARLRAEGRSIRQIAAGLDRSPSSVARELKRNSGVQVGYKPVYANEQAQARRWSGSRLDRDADLRDLVLGQLRAGWSPEQIAGRSGRRIGAETIYRFVYPQITRHKDHSWRHYLPRGKFRRGWRGKKGGSPALHMAHRLPLSHRPAEADDRTIPGHWEADLMAFARYGQNLLMLHERATRALICTILPSKQAPPVANAIGIATFFCDPHAPRQKGGIENAIGRMRRFLPRRTDLANLDDAHLRNLIAIYNNTPRKCLDWKPQPKPSQPTCCTSNESPPSRIARIVKARRAQQEHGGGCRIHYQIHRDATP